MSRVRIATPTYLSQDVILGLTVDGFLRVYDGFLYSLCTLCGVQMNLMPTLEGRVSRRLCIYSEPVFGCGKGAT